ncbi:MAG: flippase-like domain-containing protein, partial [Candidatus Latescibacteria bacterium]|nr:flippase-like domain-containing protein [Candidatus Latescibacterota bacterium]
MKRKSLKALQVLVSISLLAFLISKTDVKAILSIVGSSNLFFLLTAFLIYVSTVFIISCRWHILLQAQKINLPFKKLLTLYFIGFFFNNFLPTSVGGDLYRAYGTAKQSGKGAVSLASVFTERLVGFSAITCMFLFSLTFIAPGMDG